MGARGREPRTVFVVAAFVAFFEFAAVRWGYDSRDNFRYLNRYSR